MTPERFSQPVRPPRAGRGRPSVTAPGQRQADMRVRFRAPAIRRRASERTALSRCARCVVNRGACGRDVLQQGLGCYQVDGRVPEGRCSAPVQTSLRWNPASRACALASTNQRSPTSTHIVSNPALVAASTRGPAPQPLSTSAPSVGAALRPSHCRQVARTTCDLYPAAVAPMMNRPACAPGTRLLGLHYDASTSSNPPRSECDHNRSAARACQPAAPGRGRRRSGRPGRAERLARSMLRGTAARAAVRGCSGPVTLASDSARSALRRP